MSNDRLLQVLERWEPVIGLEIHTELTVTRTKMFCGCPVAFGGEPNTRVCPVCLGLPGALPVPNQRAIELTLLAGLATGCEISRSSQFYRKQYFYPDMPKNYQISQYDHPFCHGGRVRLRIDGRGAEQRTDIFPAASGEGGRDQGYETTVGITRIHLEEDTGKMVHVGGSEGRLSGATRSLVDFNRAGTPLIELVTEPDIRTPAEARAFAQELRAIWLALEISDCNMEEGSMRVDANVSVRPRGSTELGVKTEIKNVNSFKALHDALAFEIVRQAEVLEAGGRVVQETRHWDASAKRTSVLRSKEEVQDYRYFPEPDLVPFEFSDEFVEELRVSLPELPEAKRARFVGELGLPAHDASVLSRDPSLAAFFDSAVAIAGPQRAKAVSNVVLNELAAHVNAEGIGVNESRVTPQMVAELVLLVEEGTISSRQAKEVFAEMAGTGQAPRAIVEARGMVQVSDVSVIDAAVDRVLAEHPDKVEAYRMGKTGLIGFFVGQAMREMGGQANPKMVNELLRERLER